MTMTITVNDTIAEKVMAFLNSFPKKNGGQAKLK